jgi:hypothetical protein
MTDHVVILTGGATPGGTSPEIPDMPEYKMAAIMDDPGRYLSDDVVVAAKAGVLAGWAAGFREAAILHRVVAVWVLPDDVEARRFAELVTGQIDPAYVRRALSPMAEVLAIGEQFAREVGSRTAATGEEQGS